MEFDDVVKMRKSVRKFDKRRPSWKKVLHAIDAALQGPFAGNYNNLKFLIVENEEVIQKIAQICEQDWISLSKILIVVCSDETFVERMYGERGRIYSRQQAGAAIQTILFKLVDSGLSSCWVGAYDDGSLRDLLKIPPIIQIEAVLPVGYEGKDSEKKKDKKSLESSLFWELWGQNRRPSIFEEAKEDYRPSEPYL